MYKKGSGRSSIIVFRVKTPIKEELQRRANLTDVTLSDMIRRAVQILLSEELQLEEV